MEATEEVAAAGQEAAAAAKEAAAAAEEAAPAAEEACSEAEQQAADARLVLGADEADGALGPRARPLRVQKTSQPPSLKVTAPAADGAVESLAGTVEAPPTMTAPLASDACVGVERSALLHSGCSPRAPASRELPALEKLDFWTLPDEGFGGTNEKDEESLASRLEATCHAQFNLLRHGASLERIASNLEIAAASLAHELVGPKRAEVLETVLSLARPPPATSPPGAGGPPAKESTNARLVPAFRWVVAPQFAAEFALGGGQREVLTKVGSFEAPGCMPPAAGSLLMAAGGIYHWSLVYESPAGGAGTSAEWAFGVAAHQHSRPTRLIAARRCWKASDGQPWEPGPYGDRRVEPGELVHVQVDLRRLFHPCGTLSVALRGENYRAFFDDIPLRADLLYSPVVNLGRNGSSVRVCAVECR